MFCECVLCVCPVSVVCACVMRVFVCVLSSSGINISLLRVCVLCVVSPCVCVL